MFITRLNRLFEKHGKVAFIVMLFVIVGPFVFFIGPQSLLDAMRGKSSGPSHVVKLGDKKYNEAELRVHYAAETMRAEQMAQYGMPMPAPSVMWQSAVDRLLMLREAIKLGKGEVTTEELVKSIRSNPMLQTEGKFDQQKFEYFKMMMQKYGLTPGDYDTMARDDIVLRRLFNHYSAEAEKSLTSDEAIKKDYIENETKYDCLTRRFTGSEYEKQAEAEYLARFKTPAEREAESKKYYDATVEPMRADLEAQLTANKGNEAFREAFQNVKSTLTANLTLSDAEVEKQVGAYGDKLVKVMPFFIRERKMVMAVSFPLADYPATATAEEIQKEFDAGKDSNYKDKKLEEVKAGIQKSLERQKSLDAAGKAATSFKEAVYAVAMNLTEGQTVQKVFETVAQEHKLKVQKSTWFDDTTVDTAAGISSEVISKGYAELSDLKPLSSKIEGASACYVACWQATQPAMLPKFEAATTVDIQEKVLKVMAAEDAPKLASKDAAAVAIALKAATSPEADQIAKFKLEKETLTRAMDYNKLLAGFKTLAPGEVSSPVEIPASYMPASVMIAKLTKITPPTDEEFAKAKVEHRQTMINNEVSKKIAELRERLRKENKVEFNRLEIDRRR
jgi:hypothetical protein